MAQTFQSANTDDFRTAMKESYGPGLRNSLNNSNVGWAEATPNSEDIIGLEAVWSVHTGRSGATGNRAELGTLPTAGRQRFVKPRKPLVFMYHTIKVSGPVRHLTRGNEGAFAQALETEIKGAEKDLKRDLNRQVFGTVAPLTTANPDTWETGVIAKINGAPASNVITLDSEGDTALDDSIMRHFFVGMLVDAVAVTDGAVTEAAMEITAISVANKTITVDDDGSAADNNYIVRSGNFDREIDGLRALLSEQSPPGSADDYDYAGVDVSAQPSWIAAQVGSTTTGISEVLLDEAVEAVETDGDGSVPGLFLCEHVQRRKLASMLQAQKRYDGRQMKLTAGWDGLQLARGVLVADRFCPTSYIFGIHKPELTKFVGLDFQWDEDDGEVFFKTTTQDAIEARFKGYHQLAVTNRNSHVQIRVSEPVF